MADPVKTFSGVMADKARADGVHDFGSILGPKKTQPPDEKEKAFANSIVGVSLQDYNEDGSVDLTFDTKDIRKIWEALEDGESVDLPPVRSASIADNRNYNVKRVVFLGDKGSAKSGSTLVEELGIAGNVLQIDFNHHGFLSRLKKGDPDRGTSVGYMWTAATVNDPASKTPPTDSIFQATSASKGVTLIAYQQTSGSTTFLGGKNFNAKSPTDNFVSSYDIELSGIIKKTAFGVKFKDSVSLKFISGISTAIISDSKGQNSPGYLDKFIERLLKTLGTSQSKFDLATKWQQKRCGDWFQVLHAAMLPAMTFEPKLPENSVPVFVSHDKIAISYALEMGVKSIYFSGDSLYIFNNEVEDDAIRGQRCTARLNSLGTRAQSLLDYYKGGAFVARTTALEKYKVDVGKSIKKIGDVIDSVDKTLTLEKFAEEIRTLLAFASYYVLIEKALPNLVVIEEEFNSTNPCIKLRAVDLLEAIYKQHGNDTLIPKSIYDQFKKTMIHKSITDWKIDPKASFASRLFSMTTSDKRDAFLFLPFLQNCANPSLTDVIAKMFRKLQTWATVANIKARWPTTENRAQRVFLELATLSEQVYIFLKAKPVSTTQVEADKESFEQALAATSPEDKTENLLAFKMVEESKDFVQAESDAFDVVNTESKTGGWGERQQLINILGIDSDQCTDPILYAFNAYAGKSLRDEIYVKDTKLKELDVADVPQDDSWIGKLAGKISCRWGCCRDKPRPVSQDKPRPRGGRRPLYGGQTLTMTQQLPQTLAPESDGRAEVVIDSSISLAASRIIRDSWKLRGAPADVMEYYYRATALLTTLLDVSPTPENALAIQELITNSAFMSDEVFANAFSMDVDTARVYRLFFSSMEEYVDITPPEAPAKFLVGAKDLLTKIWKEIPAKPYVTAEEIRQMAESIRKKIATTCGIENKFPGTGQTLQPEGVAPQNPEALRAARVAALTRKGGKRRRRTRRSTNP